MNQHKLLQALSLLDTLSTQGATQQEAVQTLMSDLHLTITQSCIVVQTWLRIPAPNPQGKTLE